MDLAAYAMGSTDKFKGTGVFSSIEFSRDDNDDSKGDKTPSSKALETSTKAPPSKETVTTK
jgi:hypothetical protein